MDDFLEIEGCSIRIFDWSLFNHLIFGCFSLIVCLLVGSCCYCILCLEKQEMNNVKYAVRAGLFTWNWIRRYLWSTNGCSRRVKDLHFSRIWIPGWWVGIHFSFSLFLFIFHLRGLSFDNSWILRNSEKYMS